MKALSIERTGLMAVLSRVQSEAPFSKLKRMCGDNSISSSQAK
jgi:hypothetical protein